MGCETRLTVQQDVAMALTKLAKLGYTSAEYAEASQKAAEAISRQLPSIRSLFQK